MLSIFYGSETGTGEAFAEELESLAKEELAELDINIQVAPLDNVSEHVLTSQSVVVFIVSTTGVGEAPENSRVFGQYIGHLPNGSLPNLQYAIMGLGDMNYGETFQAFPLFMDGHLQRCGAQRLYHRGVGDDCKDIEEDFETWHSGGLWDALKSAQYSSAGATDTLQGQQISAVPSSFRVYAFLDENSCQDMLKDLSQQLLEYDRALEEEFDIMDRKAWEHLKKMPSHSLVLFLGSSKKLFRLANLNLDGGIFQSSDIVAALFQTADCENQQRNLSKLGIQVLVQTQDREHFLSQVADFCRTKIDETPKSTGKILGRIAGDQMSDANVKEMIDEKMGGHEHDENDRTQLDVGTTKTPAKQKNTILRQWFEASRLEPISRIERVAEGLYIIEFENSLGLPGYNLEILPQNTEEDVERVASALELVLDEVVHFEDGAVSFPECTVGENLMHYCDLSRRSKTSSHSGEKRMKKSLSFRELKPLKPRAYTLAGNNSILVSVTGLCSTYLSKQTVNSMVRCRSKESFLKIPDDGSRPLIMVANGAGVGVFRGFLKHWDEQGCHGQRRMLYFGCRDEGYIPYKHEFKRWQENSILHGFNIAFSRHPSHPKTYIQHTLGAHEHDIKPLLKEQNGMLYLCGGADMCNDVLNLMNEWKVDRKQITLELWSSKG